MLDSETKLKNAEKYYNEKFNNMRRVMSDVSFLRNLQKTGEVYDYKMFNLKQKKKDAKKYMKKAIHARSELKAINKTTFWTEIIDELVWKIGLALTWNITYSGHVRNISLLFKDFGYQWDITDDCIAYINLVHDFTEERASVIFSLISGNPNNVSIKILIMEPNEDSRKNINKLEMIIDKQTVMKKLDEFVDILKNNISE
jgi:hypothetical protein